MVVRCAVYFVQETGRGSNGTARDEIVPVEPDVVPMLMAIPLGEFEGERAGARGIASTVDTKLRPME